MSDTATRREELKSSIQSHKAALKEYILLNINSDMGITSFSLALRELLFEVVYAGTDLDVVESEKILRTIHKDWKVMLKKLKDQ